MKKTKKVTIRILFIAFLAAVAGQRLALHYNQPAEDWQSQALPIGNGRIGAMIFGDAQHEHLQLNEISLWTGDEKDTGSYQNLADLWLDLTHGAPQAYQRRLDIDSAIHTIQYTADGIAFRREYLASAPQQALILRYTADKSGAYNGTLKLSDAHAARTTAAGNRLSAGGKLANGLQFETVVQLVSKGGRVTASTDGLLHIENVDSLTILVAAGTNYGPRMVGAAILRTNGSTGNCAPLRQSPTPTYAQPT
jgi:alpha-L-fucosidase 2